MDWRRGVSEEVLCKVKLYSLSKPEQKEVMVKLIMNFVNSK